MFWEEEESSDLPGWKSVCILPGVFQFNNTLKTGVYMII